MNYTIYTEKEKLAHLERAQAAREKGTGSFHSYADAVGISGSTFYKWVHAHGYGEDKPKKREKPAAAFVSLGKPSQARACGEQKLVVDFCGSRIEVTVPGSQPSVPGTDSTYSTEVDRAGLAGGILKKQVPGRASTFSTS